MGVAVKIGYVLPRPAAPNFLSGSAVDLGRPSVYFPKFILKISARTLAYLGRKSARELAGLGRRSARNLRMKRMRQLPPAAGPLRKFRGAPPEFPGAFPAAFQAFPSLAKARTLGHKGRLSFAGKRL